MNDGYVPGGIIMRDLPLVVTDEDLRQSLEKHAPLVKVCRDRHKSLAYVVLEDPDVADDLISGLDGDLVLANCLLPSSLFNKLKYGYGPPEFCAFVEQYLEQLNLDCSSRPIDADAPAHRTTPGVMMCDSPSTHGVSSRQSPLPQDPRFVNSPWM